MNIYEILDNTSNVINTVIANEDFMIANYPSNNYRLVIRESVTVSTEVSRLAFLNRFTDTEAIAIDLASQGTTVEAATIRRYLSKVNAASYIDLSNPDTRASVQSLETQGLLASGRALEILDSPVQQVEFL